MVLSLPEEILGVAGHHAAPERMGSVYTALRLKMLSGRTTTILVEPPFDVNDLEYLPGLRAVSLGNLTILYEGLVYDVQPVRLAPLPGGAEEAGGGPGEHPCL